ncbi:large ribosomal subunit protein bL9m-like isoform X2 [Lytechinus pictus]
MFSSICQSLLTRSSQFMVSGFRGTAAIQWQQLRTVVIVRRLFPPPIPKLGKKYTRPKKSHKVYILEEDTTHRPRQKLKLILKDDVPKLGNRGEVVMVDKRIGRNKLIPSGAAVYASPENIQEFAMTMKKEKEESTDEGRLSPMAMKTIKHLQKNMLEVRMHADPEWTEVTKDHVIHAFRHRLGVVVAEHALKLPDETITKCGTYPLEVTINGIETVHMEMEVINFLPKRRRTQESEGSQEDA